MHEIQIFYTSIKETIRFTHRQQMFFSLFYDPVRGPAGDELTFHYTVHTAHCRLMSQGKKLAHQSVTINLSSDQQKFLFDCTLIIQVHLTHQLLYGLVITLNKIPSLQNSLSLPVTYKNKFKNCNYDITYQLPFPGHTVAKLQ